MKQHIPISIMNMKTCHLLPSPIALAMLLLWSGRASAQNPETPRAHAQRAEPSMTDQSTARRLRREMPAFQAAGPGGGAAFFDAAERHFQTILTIDRAAMGRTNINGELNIVSELPRDVENPFTTTVKTNAINIAITSEDTRIWRINRVIVAPPDRTLVIEVPYGAEGVNLFGVTKLDATAAGVGTNRSEILVGGVQLVPEAKVEVWNNFILPHLEVRR